jgi:hypothetical protein
MLAWDVPFGRTTNEAVVRASIERKPERAMARRIMKSLE